MVQIEIQTDHQNLTQRDLKSPRLLHWCLLIEEFAPKIAYIKGATNGVEDGLSCLPLTAPGRKQEPSKSVDESLELLSDLMLYYPHDVPVFPLGFENVHNKQQEDPILCWHSRSKESILNKSSMAQT